MTKYSFLKDEPVSAAEEIKFGHSDIAESLVQIITNCCTPFTLALMGSWGSGKSTILGLTKKLLENTSVSAVVFDVWKYETDDLRRSFLLNLLEHLQLNRAISADFKLNPRITQRISGVLKSEYNFNLVSLWPYIIRTSLALLSGLFLSGILALIANIMILIFWPNSLTQFQASLPAIFTGTPIIAAALSVLIKSLDNTVTVNTTNYNEERFSLPEEFQKELERILNSLSHFKTKRLVIAFDNLDRVSAERAVEIIALIKTFLEPRALTPDAAGVVFIICCDEQALIKHLAATQGDSTDLACLEWSKEFLRKFFNTRLRIPEFVVAELEQFTLDMFQKVGIEGPSLPYLARLTATSHRGSPRLMKQFVNDVATYLSIIELVASKGDIEAERVGKDLLGIALYLLLHDRGRCLLQWAQDGGAVTFSSLRALVNLSPESADITGYKGTVDRLVALAIQTYGHLSNTPIRAFSRMRLAEYESALPGCHDAMTAIRDGDIQRLIEFFRESRSQNATEYLTYALKQLSDDIPSDSIRLECTNTILLAIQDLEHALPVTVREELLRWVTHSRNADYKRFRTDLLLSGIITAEPQIAPKESLREIARRILIGAKNSGSADPPWKDDHEQTEWVTRHLCGVIAMPGNIAASMVPEFLLVLTAKENAGRVLPLHVATECQEVLKALPLPLLVDMAERATVSAEWETLDSDGLLDNGTVLNLAFKVISRVQDQYRWNEFHATFVELVRVWGTFLQFISQKYPADCRAIADSIFIYLIKSIQAICEEIDYNEAGLTEPFEKFVSETLSVMYRNLNENDQIPVVAMAAWLEWGTGSSMLVDPPHGMAISNYLRKANAEQLKQLAKWNDIGFGPYTDSNEYEAILIQRASSESGLFDSVLALLDSKKMKEWTDSFINQKPELVVNYGEASHWKNKTVRSVACERFVTRLKNESGVPAVLKISLRALDSLGEYLSDGQRTEIVSALKIALLDPRPQIQQLAHACVDSKTMLSESNWRELLQGLIDSLEHMDATSVLHTIPCNIIAALQSILSGQPIYLKRFTEYVFGKLCIDGYNNGDLARAQEGLDLLLKISPVYKDYQLYYEDILRGIKLISNAKIKAEHCARLNSLRKSSKARFWESAAAECQDKGE